MKRYYVIDKDHKCRQVEYREYAEHFHVPSSTLVVQDENGLHLEKKGHNNDQD
jgi:hypothetical protein